MVYAGDVLWWLHKFRRLVILGPALGMAVALTALIVRNAHHVIHWLSH